MENTQNNSKLEEANFGIKAPCRHDWHRLFLRPSYSVCYNCRAIKHNKTNTIIKEYVDYKDKLPKRLQT